MGDVYKRFDWNTLIDAVNTLAANPESGCDPIAPLDKVDPNHIWTKTDISTVQDKLKEICDENNFDTIPILWKQSIIDEINDALDKGWCGCRECIECPWNFNVAAASFITSQDAPDYIDPYTHKPRGAQYCNYPAHIEGMSLGLPGFGGGIFGCRLSWGWSGYSAGGGTIDCNGILHFPAWMLNTPPPATWGAAVTSGWCWCCPESPETAKMSIFIGCASNCTVQGKPIGTKTLHKC